MKFYVFFFIILTGLNLSILSMEQTKENKRVSFANPLTTEYIIPETKVTPLQKLGRLCERDQRKILKKQLAERAKHLPDPNAIQYGKVLLPDPNSIFSSVSKV